MMMMMKLVYKFMVFFIVLCLMSVFGAACALCRFGRVQEVLDGLAITNDHFKFALQHCNPSALRETLVEVRLDLCPFIGSLVENGPAHGA